MREMRVFLLDLWVFASVPEKFDVIFFITVDVWRAELIVLMNDSVPGFSQNVQVTQSFALFLFLYT